MSGVDILDAGRSGMCKGGRIGVKRVDYLHLTRKNASGKCLVICEALLSIVLAGGAVAPIKMPGGENKGLAFSAS